MDSNRPHIAIGPRYPGIGSWEWVGEEMAEELSKYYDIDFFDDRIPQSDLAIIVKYDFARLLSTVPPNIPIIYCPIDCYASAADIDRDGGSLFRCQSIVIHSEFLRKYFRPYATVEYLDHHVRFVPQNMVDSSDGPILWTGIDTNLPPLVDWVNQHALPRELWILTNLANGQQSLDPQHFGFNKNNSVRIENWSELRHLEWASVASAAIDIKADNFRARHKPPAKALDALASGLPLAMNSDSSSVKHISRLGFEVSVPENLDYWLSLEYREATVKFGSGLRKLLTRERIGQRFKQIIDGVLSESNNKKQAQQQAVSINHSVNVNAKTVDLDLKRSTSPKKIAVLSFLFNWPSTGGGNIHTVELVQSLQQAGYQVKHYCPRFEPWQIGHVEQESPIKTQILDFSTDEWQPSAIRSRFQNAVDEFAPDYVIITDSWNFKPHLAVAVRDYPYFLRMQALECLCPLNNLQLLPDNNGVSICSNNQLKQSQVCFDCLTRNRSGQLHEAERQLSGVGSEDYHKLLQQSIREAEAVLVLNPTIAEQYRAIYPNVEVVTWGMDPFRFPWPVPEGELAPKEISSDKTTLLFAGLLYEPIKGFEVLRAACNRLWKRRQDFELLVTSDSQREQEKFIRCIGWKTQAELPLWYRHADLCIVPTIVPDGLSRTSVEAMASGTPVLASRIGGLPYSVSDGENGLLCNPGDVNDWINKLEYLLNHPEQRTEMGIKGRRIFEERFLWEDIIEHDYRRLFEQVIKQQSESNI